MGSRGRATVQENWAMWRKGNSWGGGGNDGSRGGAKGGGDGKASEEFFPIMMFFFSPSLSPEWGGGFM